ncbi:MAG: alpha/beta hydrolase [Candidatus Eisenbacteria bacterium]|nr:alpha/beta hydrolase [Candidatus Eisenbacteria bacterium]
MNARRLLVTVAALAVLLAAPLVAGPPLAPKTMDLGRGPTVVILHDLGGTRLNWMPTVRRLIADHHVVLVDLPGHGDSALPDPFSLEAAAQAVDQVLAKQNPDSTVLIGKGMGGLLALIALQAHPERVRGLVLIDAAAKPPIKVDDQQMKMFVEWMDQNYDEFVKTIYTKMGRDSAQGVAIHALAAQTPSVTMKAYLRAAMTADGSQVLRSAKVPLLYLGSDRVLQGKDWAAAGKEIGFDDPSLVPFRRIANAGYLMQQEQPDSLAAAIAEFEARVIARK